MNFFCYAIALACINPVGTFSWAENSQFILVIRNTVFLTFWHKGHSFFDLWADSVIHWTISIEHVLYRDEWPCMKESTLTGTIDMCPLLPVWQLWSTGLQAMSRDPHLVWDSQGNFLRSECWADSWWRKNNQLSFGEVNEKRKGFQKGERAYAKT